MVRFAVAALVAACGDNLHEVDAPAPLPDLAVVGAEMDGTVAISDAPFTADSCEVVEGCAVPGVRRLLRFATVTENRGPGDLLLGAVPPPGVSNGIFVWSPCHMHHHVMNYASYELRDATGVVTTGHKQGFCLEDDEQIGSGPSHHYNCNFQGISPGWADVYGNGLPCQWVDITDVVPGTYTLRVVVDPLGVLADSDASNNEWTTSVTF
jgi:hypothetical protein